MELISSLCVNPSTGHRAFVAAHAFGETFVIFGSGAFLRVCDSCLRSEERLAIPNVPSVSSHHGRLHNDGILVKLLTSPDSALYRSLRNAAVSDSNRVVYLTLLDVSSFSSRWCAV